MCSSNLQLSRSKEDSISQKKRQNWKKGRYSLPGCFSRLQCPYECRRQTGSNKIHLRSRQKKQKVVASHFFFYFIDICVVNSYIIYKKLQLPQKTMKNFRREIVHSLVTPLLISKKKRKSTSGKSAPVQIKKHKPHVPIEVRLKESAHQPERSTRRRCALCSTKEKQIRTDWKCGTCNVLLCMSKGRNCFSNFHN